MVTKQSSLAEIPLEFFFLWTNKNFSTKNNHCIWSNQSSATFKKFENFFIIGMKNFNEKKIIIWIREDHLLISKWWSSSWSVRMDRLDGDDDDDDRHSHWFIHLMIVGIYFLLLFHSFIHRWWSMFFFGCSSLHSTYVHT